MLGRCPMSRVELAPSYRASQLRPASCGTMRGATAPTAGSAKCGSSASSQPGPGTQSESRNATSGVSAAARPVFLAAAGPPLTGRRSTLAPAAAATLLTAAWSREPSSTTITRGASASPARQRASSAWPVADRDDHGHIWLPRWRGAVQHGVGDPGVEEAARQRAGLRVIGHWHARPPGGDMPGPRLAQPQHPGGVTARDDHPVRQRARPRIGTQAESRRDQLVARSLSC